MSFEQPEPGFVRKSAKLVAAATKSASIVLSVMAAGATIILMVAVIAEVIHRQWGHGSIPGMLEISAVLLVFVTFWGLPEAERTGAHVRTTVLTQLLPGKGRWIAISAAHLIYLFVVGVMAWASTDRAMESVRRREYDAGLLDVPVYPSRVAIAVGLSLLFLVILVKLAKHVLGQNTKSSPAPGLELTQEPPY